MQLQRKEVPEGASSAYAAIHQNMIKAYWDIIQEDIRKEPPVLDMVFKLCADIRSACVKLIKKTTMLNKAPYCLYSIKSAQFCSLISFGELPTETSVLQISSLGHFPSLFVVTIEIVPS